MLNAKVHMLGLWFKLCEKKMEVAALEIEFQDSRLQQFYREQRAIEQRAINGKSDPDIAVLIRQAKGARKKAVADLEQWQMETDIARGHFAIARG